MGTGLPATCVSKGLNSGTAVVDLLPYGDLFFLIVGNDDSDEGSYGRAGSGSERPESVGTPGCDLPQDLTATCDPPL